ncbi:MAG TPA: EAL domain-containing protein [Burkholderiaceae bacterium]|nr:EAL domain-containing protein [Burkholderiaceae bacterium]
MQELSADSYRVLVEQVQAAMFVIQNDRFRFVNPKLTQLFGYSMEEFLDGMDPSDLTIPEERARVREQVRQRVQGVPGRAYDISCIRKDGSFFSARVWGVHIALDGEPADLVTLHDVSEIKQATQAAQQRAQLLAHAEELAHIGSAETDLASDVVTLSAGMFALLGEPVSEQKFSRDWLFTRVPFGERAFVRGISEGVSPGETCEFQHRIVHADGTQRIVLHRGLVEAGAQGQPVRSLTILQDITVQRTAEQRLDLLANSDEVTGLPNRSGLADRLDAAVRQARREDRQIAVLGIEIDQLKLVSESLGYAGGDRLLAAVAKRLSGALSPQDTLAHLGSAEYVALLNRSEDVGEVQAQAIAQMLIEALAAPFPIDDSEVKVSCGIGVCLFPRDGDGVDKLLHQAQAAMYRAHELGDNRVCFFSPEANAKAAVRLAMEAALRRALQRGEFQLRYQPQLDLASGGVVGVEALLRWNAEARGAVPLSEFLPVAEETGLSLPIGEWVLRTACTQSLAWQRAGFAPLRMAVNLTIRQLQQADIVRRIQAILMETGLDPHHLSLEVTESGLMGEGAHVSRVLAELKALGVEIALDGFGTGYSSLSRLRQLPIDVVKVDRSFVHDVTAAPEDVSITRAVITMAHSLQMKVLATGVETEGQLALLVSNRCDRMQGNYFSNPITGEAVAAMLREGRQLPEKLLQRRTQKRTLLLVDDEESIVSSLKRLLRRDGYQVVTANSGAQGLQRMAENAVDVIVSDQRMPGMTGVEFLRRAKELYPDTVRMVLSGYTELQSITDAINEGAIYKFLTKPWDDERLRGHIQEAFHHKELADENRRLGGAVVAANQELAEVNERLQRLLDTQREQITREETSLLIAREMIENIPAPVLGFDQEGMIAFVNADAERLFSQEAGLLGRGAQEALADDLLAVWQHGDGAYHRVSVAGQPYQAVCREMHSATRSRGKLLVLTPSAIAH